MRYRLGICASLANIWRKRLNLSNRKKVIIVGGGFGGLHAAKALRKADVEVTIIDRRNFHLFQPLLYQVATGGLSPANIAAPIRSMFRKQENAKVVLGEVVAVDPAEKTVEVRSMEPCEVKAHSQTLSYDWLIVAAGATHSYFGNDQWEEIAPGLKTIEDATEIRRRVLAAFEAAEVEADTKRRDELLTFVVIGGGPTGVELSGAISELARHTLQYDFRNIDPKHARVILVEGHDRVLSPFVPSLSAKAEASLKKLEVELRLGTHVTSIEPHQVTLKIKADDSEMVIATRTVLWAAGVAGVPLGKTLAEATGVTLARGGRVPIQADLTVEGHPEIFVIGDLSSSNDKDGNPLPGVAQVAMQQGTYASKLIIGQIEGQPKPEPFSYSDKGSLATIGRSMAIADLGFMRFSGFFAWLLWLLVHIVTLAKFHNRVLVLAQWGWNYLTFNRSARLITNTEPVGKDDCQSET